MSCRAVLTMRDRTRPCGVLRPADNPLSSTLTMIVTFTARPIPSVTLFLIDRKEVGMP